MIVRILLISILLIACDPTSGAWLPCQGQTGTFSGSLQVVKNTCGEYLGEINGTVELEVTEDSKLRECSTHILNISEAAGAYLHHAWCEDILLTTVEPSNTEYIGRQYYDLSCINPEFYCTAEVEVTLEKQ